MGLRSSGVIKKQNSLTLKLLNSSTPKLNAMNIPNTLTIFRILLVPVFIIFLINNNLWMALMIFILAGITDGLDGLIARVLNQRTLIGAYLDPIADKFLLISAYLALTIKNMLPAWLSVIVISRDIIILSGIALLFLMAKKFVIRPSLLSKATTVSQILAIIAVLSDIENYYLIQIVVVTALLTIGSCFQYIYRGILIMGEDSA